MLSNNALKTDRPVEALLEELTSASCDSSLLLQYLIQVQQALNFVPQSAVDWLASALALTPAHIDGVISFYSFLHTEPRGSFDILFSDSITDHMLGSLALINQLCERLEVSLGAPRVDGRVTVDVTSCTGMCDQGPALLVNRRAITQLDTKRIEQIALLVDQDIPLDLWPQEFFVVEDRIQRRDLMLSEMLVPGAAIEAALSSGAQTLLDELDISGLRGRGGAGFTTAMKWSFCLQSEGDTRYVVCNADEGEPGTFKDRILLNSYADEVIEGMTVCAAVVGAQKGFIYLRGEYLHLLEPLEAVLANRRGNGLLGNSIHGHKGFNFDIDIHLGAGAYICGEESALIESLEGKRGIPRNRPPFPVAKGYMQQPTVLNNVETFVAAAHIAVHGGAWFSAKGTEHSGGIKLLSISGDCETPGIYEFPFGVTVLEVLEACGGSDAQAVQVAGAAGVTVPASEFKRTIAFEDIATGGAFMVFGQSRSMLEMVQNFAHFFVHESCGFCTPCRVGGVLLRDLVDKAANNKATEYDLNEMRSISEVMRKNSHCGLGATASNPVMDTLDKFPQIYSEKLLQADFEPAFDLDAALEEARNLTGRDDPEAHIKGAV